MDPKFSESYPELYRRHWWFRAREKVILETLARHRPPGGWRTVLDVGCGEGLFFDVLCSLEGVTLVEGLEPYASNASALGPHHEHIYSQPFDETFQPGRRYSVILMLDVVEHLPDPENAMRHAVSLLEPDGVILVTVPAFMSLWTRHDELNYHFTRYTKRTFRALAETAALRIDEARYFFFWIALAKVGVRLAERIVPGKPRIPAVPPAFINRFLYLVSRMEEYAPFSYPFGSSLLVVARKAHA
jgi:2-polyprenyl-3-methyl-5-hydroxy-6-metoxy-1,4-benzoquinol methylase